MHHYYICEYADYTDLPDKLFCEHSPSGLERKSLDGLQFVSRCEDHSAGSECLSWMNGGETEYTHSEIITELKTSEWINTEE